MHAALDSWKEIILAKPIVAVVGRPNVGKSTFVNRVSQRPEAIVHETSGVTRDRTTHDAEWNGVEFTLIDTGGIEVVSSDDVFSGKIREQAELAIEEADAVVFLVDSKTGITKEDDVVAAILKRADTPVLLAVNKCDSVLQDSYAYEFYSLGLGDPYPISSQHGNGVGDLLDDLVKLLPVFDDDAEDDMPAIAIIGRPNAGKSSLLNRLSGSDRSIVSDVAGTTRDVVDTIVEHEGKAYKLVDTAGMRKRTNISEDLEYYSYVRSERAIERADVALLVVDSTVGITDQDQRLAGMADESGCGLIVLLNKWDLVTDPERREELVEDISERLHFVTYALNLRISALTGRSVERIWGLVETVLAHRSQSIPTSQLNALLTELREFGHTVSVGKQRLKMNYVTQTGTEPPVFTFFVNNPTLVNKNFERYLENRLRDRFDLTGTPIRLKFKKKAQ
jgi:GTP-binding protein